MEDFTYKTFEDRRYRTQKDETEMNEKQKKEEQRKTYKKKRSSIHRLQNRISISKCIFNGNKRTNAEAFLFMYDNVVMCEASEDEKSVTSLADLQGDARSVKHFKFISCLFLIDWKKKFSEVCFD